jgi:uncharacterized membrane protein (UPF0136 family)
MRNLSDIGRIFYGISIAVMGLVTIYDHDFPYMLIPAGRSWLVGHEIVAYISGALLILAGVFIAFAKKTLPVSLLLGTALLAIFCFYFIPYQLMASPRYMHFGQWENAAKELALAGGAFVIAGCFSRKFMPVGVILYAITIISFGIDHFLFAREASDYIPSWIPGHLFWMYFTGSALLGSGIAIILKIRPGLFAALLGGMIFVWFIILHVPRVIASPSAYIGSEVTSAFIALAYGGIAFVIAGAGRKTQ